MRIFTRFNNSSGVTGVSWHPEKDKWVSKLMVGGKAIHLGYYRRLSDAEAAVTEAREKCGEHIYKSNTSGVRGVKLKRGKFTAYATVNGCYYHIGTYITIDAAAEARREFLENTND